jgi:hypothetical protein
MEKRIEIVSASDPEVLKQQLEQLVNTGWNIKGVVGHNPNKPYSEPFVILERDAADDPTLNEGLYENNESVSEQEYLIHPEPPQKEISISMGN